MSVLNYEASEAMNTDAEDFFFYRDLLSEVEHEIKMRESAFTLNSPSIQGQVITKIAVYPGGHQKPQVIEGRWSTFEVSVLFPVSIDEGDALLEELSPYEQDQATVVFYDDNSEEIHRDVRVHKEDLRDVVPDWYITSFSQDI